MNYEPSTRAKVITRRTYNRPLNEEANVFETWEQTVGRTIDHQRWLWQRAKGEPLDMLERQELIDLAELLKDRKEIIQKKKKLLIYSQDWILTEKTGT